MYREMGFHDTNETLMLRPFMLIMRGLDGKLYIRAYVPGFGQIRVEVRAWNPANKICEALDANNRDMMLEALSTPGVPAWARTAAEYFA
jgi:hypothetical protein